MRWQSQSLSPLPKISHGFFGRRGGVSRGPWATLNVSLRNGDDREAVLENRRRIARELGLDGAPLAIARQVHGTRCHLVMDPWPDDEPPEADALMTTRPGIIIGVTTADCVPILLGEPTARVVAAVHAGWRGAKAGAIECAIRRMEEVGASPSAITAAVGPAIAWRSYEVGHDFERDFIEDDPGNARFFARGPSGRPHFDLRRYCIKHLRKAGIMSIDDLDHDTFKQEELFFSYRRARSNDEERFGLQLAAVALSS